MNLFRNHRLRRGRRVGVGGVEIIQTVNNRNEVEADDSRWIMLSTGLF
jgi:hypothetical protein